LLAELSRASAVSPGLHHGHGGPYDRRSLHCTAPGLGQPRPGLRQTTPAARPRPWMILRTNAAPANRGSVTASHGLDNVFIASVPRRCRRASVARTVLDIIRRRPVTNGRWRGIDARAAAHKTMTSVLAHGSVPRTGLSAYPLNQASSLGPREISRCGPALPFKSPFVGLATDRRLDLTGRRKQASQRPRQRSRRSLPSVRSIRSGSRSGRIMRMPTAARPPSGRSGPQEPYAGV
jgi:hypothetical protein